LSAPAYGPVCVARGDRGAPPPCRGAAFPTLRCKARQPAPRATRSSVIDDDAHVREVIRDVLQSVGLDTLGFGSAEELSITKLREQPSCLVLDVRLPGLSGLDIQAAMAAAQIEVPIIFITGYGDIPMTVKHMKAGAVESLSKPIREQELLDAVRAALDRDHLRRERDQETNNWRAQFDELSGRERQVMALLTAG